MMIKLYAVVGILAVGALAWVNYTGWSYGEVTEVKEVPKSVRNNPGSYRSSYSWIRMHTGGK